MLCNITPHQENRVEVKAVQRCNDHNCIYMQTVVVVVLHSFALRIVPLP